MTDGKDIINSIATYKPCNEQEETDKKLILELIKTHKNIFSRDCLAAHMTASAWVTDIKK